MNTRTEIQAILKALQAKRTELQNYLHSPVACVNIEHDIRNLRYALENAVIKFFNNNKEN